MDEDIKFCENCNREIPTVNYTTHSVHCTRNIRMCPVCKEPMLLTELEEHTKKLHKLLPCKQCGEKVRGTDMEDHIRDSCDHTIQTCRWCELELSRRELPLHEGYCGARTEECDQCGEFVMHKYRQLHLDSNHGFVRLDDDPVPRPNRQRPVATVSVIGSGVRYHRPADRLPRLLAMPEQPPTSSPELSRIFTAFRDTNALGYFNDHRDRTQSPRSPDAANERPSDDGWDQPNINLNVPTHNENEQGTSNNNVKPLPGGAVKKRKAPKPPNATTPESSSDQAPQPPQAPVPRAYSLFPPSTSTSTPNAPVSAPNPAPQEDRAPSPIVIRYRGPRNGPTTGPIPVTPGSTPDSQSDNTSGLLAFETSGPRPGLVPGTGPNRGPLSGRNIAVQSLNNLPPDSTNGRPAGAVADEEIPDEEVPDEVQQGNECNNSDPEDVADEMNQKSDFRKATPMTTEEFLKRVQLIQMNSPKQEPEIPPLGTLPRREEVSEPPAPHPGDRFNAIKSSLKELRKGLNEVTAPYNKNNEKGYVRRSFLCLNRNKQKSKSSSSSSRSSDSDSDGNEAVGRNKPVDEPSPAWGGDPGIWGNEAAGRDEAADWGDFASAAGGDEAADWEEFAGALDTIDVKLPCEFCGTLIQANDLVQHQTGCRPDLAQFYPADIVGDDRGEEQEPFIPCEFCSHRVPLKLIGAHQERCSRLMNRMSMN